MTRPPSHYVALIVILLVVVLGAANWYEQPERGAAWLTAMLVLPAGWGLASLVSRRTARAGREASARQADQAVGTAITFGGLIILASLAENVLSSWLGPAALPAGLDQRATMILAGVYLVFTGNSMPKMLVPLSSLQCDGSRTQAFQRTAGRIWVMSGLTFAVSWLLLPVAFARLVSLTVMAGGILIVAAQAFRLHQARRRPLAAGPGE